MALPKFLQTCLWSYDISQMDPYDPDDKELIIQQVLNRGNIRAVKWLFKTYKKQDIVEVVKNPRRGMWFPKSLNYWAKILDVKIPKQVYKWAILDINPRFDVFKDYFKLSKKKSF
ncbi:hypothetical protein MYX06_00805 [Patescibacteria group bacterium AH-259-L05]|nr:hypothetical protein [Patescibacteria group bacterium AH-259-L05]